MRRTKARIAQLRAHLERVHWRDKQAAELYRLLHEALPTTKFVLCKYDVILKNYYTDDAIRHVAYAQNPFFAMLEKETNAAAKAYSRKLIQTCYVTPDENVPTDRAYGIDWRREYLGMWCPDAEPEASATFKNEDKMATWHETEKPVKYGNDKFTVAFEGDAYREGWERMFGENTEDIAEAPLPDSGTPMSTDTPLPEPEQTWPCKSCGKPMTKDEGGTVFTVCEGCWNDVLPIG